MQFIERSNIRLRRSIIRWYLAALPMLGFLIYLFVPNFVVLIMIGGLTSAIFLPIQSGATLWLQATHMDKRIRPRPLTQFALWAVFLFELVMALFVVWFVVLAPFRGG